jgi:hypothetical protein
MSKYRFFFWIVLFSLLLSIIPILFLSGYSLTGKILGIILIVSLSIALWIWRIQTLKQMAYHQRIRLNTNDCFWLKENIPFYRRLNSKDKSVFEDRLGLILANVEIMDQNGKIPERIEAVSLCALATILLWDLPLFIFENSKWCIGEYNLDSDLENVYSFSITEINEKLKDNFMLINLRDSLNKENQLGCIANFLEDLAKRFKNSKHFKPYEEDFWNYYSRNKLEFENIKVHNSL